MIHLSVHMPIWGRSETVGMVVEQWEHVRLQLAGQVNIWPFAIVSPDDPDPTDTSYLAGLGWGVVTTPNLPLGKKWNVGWDGIHLAMPLRHYPHQAHMQVGSDNLINPGYIMDAIKLIHLGDGYDGQADHVALDSCYYLNTVDGGGGLCTAGLKWGYGPGRLMSYRIMQAMGWRPYNSKKSRKMDEMVDARLEKVKASPYKLSMSPSQGRIMVDLKGPGSKNDYNAARKRRSREGLWHDVDHGFIPGLFPHLNWPAHMVEVHDGS